jgi:hypothetical protein
MSIDLGNAPVGTPPTPTEQVQMRTSLGISATTPLYILAQGQSNINPRGVAIDTATNPSVYIWNNNGNNTWEVWDLAANPTQTKWGGVGGASWAFYAACRIQESTGNEVRVILNAKSGVQIDEFLDGASMWEELTNGVNGILELANVPAASIAVRLWGQGEADAGESPSSYLTKYDTVRSQIDALSETTYGFPTIVMPLAETTGSQDTQNAALFTFRNDITGRNYLMDGAQFLSTEVDGYHYDGAAHVSMGRHFAWAALHATDPVNTVVDQLRNASTPFWTADVSSTSEHGQTGGANAVSAYGTMLTVGTTATAGSKARYALSGPDQLIKAMPAPSYGRFDWTVAGSFSFMMRHGWGATNGSAYITLSDKAYNSSTIGFVATNGVVGFEILNNTMRCLVGNGTTLGTVGNNIALSTNPVNCRMDAYKIIWDGQGYVQFFRNDLLVGESDSAPLLATKAAYVTVEVDNAADAEEQYFRIAAISIR